MIGRRQALRAIFAAPAVAKAAVTAASEVGVQPKLNPIEDPSCDIGKVGHDPLWGVFQEAEREDDLRRQIRGADQEFYPHHIKSKISWSPAFKASVYAKEERELQAARNLLQDLRWGENWRGKSTAQKLKKLAELGIDITGVKL